MAWAMAIKVREDTNLEYYLNVDLIEQVMTERGSSKGGISRMTY